MKVKVFEGLVCPTPHQYNFGMTRLEDDLNEWLEANQDIRIKDIKQSSSSDGDQEVFSSITTISIWYEQ